jgi:Fe-S-cluster-containing dehydrogenase component
MHCQNPPCVKLCPWGAADQLDNGIVRIDSDICLGGAKCKTVCPWQIPERQTGVGMYLDILPRYAGNGVMYKCDRCYQKVAQGEPPACVEICPEKVQKIGPREEIIKEAHALAKEINGFIYGEKENGGTNTIYVSPVPFDVLNKAIEKGPGKPHLGPAKEAMAQTNNLVTALAIAPVAGIVGAVGRFLSLAKKDQAQGKEAQS